jgi:hypothetical protein
MLGRNLNDYVTSYYVYTPSGFFAESGGAAGHRPRHVDVARDL